MSECRFSLQELQYQQRKAVEGLQGREDTFLSVMSAFLQVACCRFDDLEDDFRDMKEKVSRERIKIML